MKLTMCDPPSGWKYGFPRAIPETVLKEMEKEKKGLLAPESFYQWLNDCGYPQSLIESYGDHFYCRFWEVLTAYENPTKSKEIG
jgi:hypothetical protein